MAVTKVVMPKLSEAMDTGKIIKWLKKEGDRVQGGDILAEIETDKADVEMEAFGAGVLRKILVGPGDRAPVGSLIAVIAEPNDDIASVIAGAASPAPAAGKPAAPASVPGATSDRSAAVPPQPRSEDPAARQPAPAKSPAGPGAGSGPQEIRREPAARPAAPVMAPVASVSHADGRIKASPLAKKVAAQRGVDLKVVQGSGPGGRIIRRDVEAATSAPAAAPAIARAMPSVTGPEYEDRPLTQIRATIAKRMPLSKAPVPHFYVTSEVVMDRAWELREELNALDGAPKISVNDLVIRACALALLQHPEVNASFQGDSVRVWHRAHIGIAVALEEGLITPVLRDCQAKSLSQIAVESRDLAERTRARKLKAHELSGATFSISNLGMFDVAEFSAIINPPEGAILAVGSVRRVPVADGDEVTVGRRMMLTISCDHRVMDGAMGARFLQTVKRYLEEPLRLLV
ncbi:MAG: dihydrolipoamide acyltransferase [Candidatus Rokuibacteriota bacterium]|nr:MAG: dihydrolipoamide acyltransferase [Candidatus Rokubacteria bacterium]